jgi:hypothetical protein
MSLPVWFVDFLGHSATSLRGMSIEIQFWRFVFQNYVSTHIYIAGVVQVLGSAGV